MTLLLILLGISAFDANQDYTRARRNQRNNTNIHRTKKE